MKTILLTGARAPATLDLARALHENGHRVIAAESMEHPLSIYSRAFGSFYKVTAPNISAQSFIDDLISIIIHERVDILLPTCEEVFHIATGKSELSKYCTVLVDEAEKLKILHSKFEFNLKALALGFDVPRSHLVRSVKDAKEILNSVFLKESSVVLKPEYSRFAAKTLILKRDEALARVEFLSLSSGVPWVIQEYIQGTEYCTYALAINGNLITQVTYDHEFTAGRGAGICFRSIRHPKIEAWVKKFVGDLNFTGQIAFDFIERLENIYPLECNPRATSGLHLIAHEPQFIEALVHQKTLTSPIQAAPHSIAQIRLAMLVYGLVSIRSFSRLFKWIKIFFTAREVVFSWEDPRPFLDQFYTFFYLTREARRRGITALELSTHDIEWNG